MFEKFSDGARRALTGAREAARVRDADEISLGHVLLGLSGSGSEATRLLQEAGVMGERIASLLAPEVSAPRVAVGEPIPFSDASKAVLIDAVRLATTAEGLDAVRSDHLLMAITAGDAPEVVSLTSQLGIFDG